ncbi:prephenate dehydratase [Ruminiclostridium sufflavum DSM 19573]|uniref:Prephenate dehydratase n=1 Tax=Ruminiclostridium sufflavum DSM 19573 TaxID=1121337 RepID=A0A318XPV7_9FIRM|nr:prephenate dehydratase [Ruminiclostridium sufflavum]PYG89095.1 prephenate dehydratase [Ruminiclostridium sufflavum DSM 19573]
MNRILGFLGPQGTFSHEAAQSYIDSRVKNEPMNKAYLLKDFYTIREVLLGLKNNEIDEAIVPIENSLEGAVNVTLDILAEEDGLYIVDEHIIPINLNLVAKEGTLPKDIKVIISHPQPLGQCRNYLNDTFQAIVQLEESSTSKAAQRVAAGDGTYAAVASSIAAKMYGLQILNSNIQDAKNNYTRFVVLSKAMKNKTGRDKTSIVFSTENRPGSLYKILDIFSLWDINMTRIESRPAKNVLGQYIFFIDIDGHINEQDVSDALTMVRRKTSFYRFIGSYPTFDCPYDV